MDDIDLPSPKRRRVGEPSQSEVDDSPAEELSSLTTINRPVSPPQIKRRKTEQNDPPHCISSPIQLTRIGDLSDRCNVDTIELKDILGDPLIKECWQFNFLIDLDFLMNAFDEDVRNLVQVKIVHGSWRRDDARRQRLEEGAKRYPNVQLITAYMPEAFGTHHSKMMCIFRHDDTAEIVIHTANMRRSDWEILCQAVWRSPRLPLIVEGASKDEYSNEQKPVGSGARFKHDFIGYVKAYGKNRTGALTELLPQYDFSEIRAALVASVPSKQKLEDATKLWGWPALRQVLRAIPSSGSKPTLVTQVSSIATFTKDWIGAFLKVLSAKAPTSADERSRDADGSPEPLTLPRSSAVNAHIIFPTADEIRRSVGGYDSGDSIHMKITSPAQAKQLEHLHPMLCHWAEAAEPQANVREAGRRRAAPHIKTYMRFTDATLRTIDWAMVTSANLSTQAWGALPNKDDEVRICSWELGVVVWPQLFGDNAAMVPTFMKDAPTPESVAGGSPTTLIGIRMPYDLPLAPYTSSELPWCATASHTERDWKGQAWQL